MEAKDTIMTREEINAMDWTGDVGHLCAEVAKAQAEISFPLGKQEGIREVVEWVESNSQEASALSWKFRQKWQAKLKEWAE